MSIKFKPPSFSSHLIGLILLVTSAGSITEAEPFRPSTPEQKFSKRMFDAYQNPAPWPVFTGTMDEAYLNQMGFIRRLDERVIGFKAGLTNPQAQKRFATTGPVSGVLTQSMVSNEELRRSSFVRPMLEMELGYVLGEAVDKPLSDLRAVRQVVKYMLAVIEVPDLSFESGPPTGPIIVAANVAVRRVLIGTKRLRIDSDGSEEDKVGIELHRDGELILLAETEMRQQLETLRWLINHNLAVGHEILAGQLFITGAIGGMQEAELGQYRANFMGIDEIAFKISP